MRALHSLGQRILTVLAVGALLLSAIEHESLLLPTEAVANMESDSAQPEARGLPGAKPGATEVSARPENPTLNFAPATGGITYGQARLEARGGRLQSVQPARARLPGMLTLRL